MAHVISRSPAPPWRWGLAASIAAHAALIVMSAGPERLAPAAPPSPARIGLRWVAAPAPVPPEPRSAPKEVRRLPKPAPLSRRPTTEALPERTITAPPAAGPASGAGPAASPPAAIAKAAPPAPPAVKDRHAWLAPVLDELRRRLHAARDYPRLARRMGLEGTVLLRASIGPGGRIARWEIAERSPHAVLDRAALESAARVDGVGAAAGAAIPGEILVAVPLRFVLDEGGGGR